MTAKSDGVQQLQKLTFKLQTDVVSFQELLGLAHSFDHLDGAEVREKSNRSRKSHLM